MSDPLAALRPLIAGIGARRFGVIAFVIPALVRAVPELLAGQYPLGFDTVWFYAPFVKVVETQGLNVAFSEIISARAAPLMFMLLAIGAASSADPFLITKTFAPFLQGLLVFATYYFAKRGLGWNQKMCFLVILVSSFYFVPLRLSWDLYRNTLGYAFLIMALAHLKTSPTHVDKWPFLSLAGLTILASEFTTVLLGTISGLVSIFEVLRYRRVNYLLLISTVVAFLAAFIYLGLFFPAPLPKTPLSLTSPSSSLLYNYVGAAEDVYNYPSLGDVYVTVLMLGGMTLAPLLPFAWLGFHNERRLLAWTGSLAGAAFSPILDPFAAVPGWYRWLLMLTFPMLLFSVKGVMKMRKEGTVILLGIILALSISFMVLPPDGALHYFTNPRTLPYIPSSMLQNTVPLQDSADTVKALQWLNRLQSSDSVIVTHISFQGWAILYSANPEVYGFVDAAQVDYGNFSSYRQVFLLYWAPHQGWYNQRLMPSNMTEVYQTGRIAVYERAP